MISPIDEDIRVAETADGPRYLMEPSPLAKLIQLARDRAWTLCSMSGAARATPRRFFQAGARRGGARMDLPLAEVRPAPRFPGSAAAT